MNLVNQCFFATTNPEGEQTYRRSIKKAHLVSQMSLKYVERRTVVESNFTLTYLFPPLAGSDLAPSYR